MAHEIVEIPITRGPLYEAVAVFMGTLAYPDYKAGRERLRKAWCRGLFDRKPPGTPLLRAESMAVRNTC